MAVTYAFLTDVNLARLHQTQLLAFSDYHLDMSYMTQERIRLRAIKNNVQFDKSVGAFDGDELVGFTLIGIDQWGGELAAFDAATGIVPAFRGQGIAKQMFEFALGDLKNAGVTRFVLEVLVPNEAAIRAYTKTGFEITRHLDCFILGRQSVRVDTGALHPWEIRAVDKPAVSRFEQLTDWQPSWENSFAAIARIEDDLVMLGAFDGNDCVGILVYYPTLNWIMSLVVAPGRRRQGVATALVHRLVADLADGLEALKLINVLHEDTGMRAFLHQTGFEFQIDQYEMAYPLV
ncbi:MAG: GNAT family N-acetyltransferase [Myxococcota bacterium]|nr:GNAT family N-acetyltransferase [Myxococcota bacterium]